MFSLAECLHRFPLVFAQRGSGAYGAGQIAGVIFLIVLAGAILWKVLKR